MGEASKGIPAAVYSARFQPAPMAISRRPSLSRSSVASSWARTIGWRRSLLRTKVPMRRRVVAAATVARVAMGPSGMTRWSGMTATA